MVCCLGGELMVNWHATLHGAYKIVGLTPIVDFYPMIMHLGGTRMCLRKGEVEIDGPPPKVTPTQV